MPHLLLPLMSFFEGGVLMCVLYIPRHPCTIVELTMIVRVDIQMGGWRMRMTKRAHQTAFTGEMDEARAASC